MATEFSRDKQTTLQGLRQSIERSSSKRALGSTYYEDMDESGPGYSIRSSPDVAFEQIEQSPEPKLSK
jgi:hypothetical protein